MFVTGFFLSFHGTLEEIFFALSYGGLGGITIDQLSKMSFEEIDKLIFSMNEQKRKELEQIQAARKGG
jgi:hypothetical protein